MDVISKEEFDSQRGTDEQRDDLGDSDLVFPLDLQEPSTKAESVPAIGKPVPEEPKQQPHQERERAGERGREASPSKGGASRSKKGKWEKRARFYPVPCKQESPTKVHSFVCLADRKEYHQYPYSVHVSFLLSYLLA